MNQKSQVQFESAVQLNTKMLFFFRKGEITMAENKKTNFLIGARIRAARKAKDLSQEKLAEKLDVSTAAVSTWERGEFIHHIHDHMDLP